MRINHLFNRALACLMTAALIVSPLVCDVAAAGRRGNKKVEEPGMPLIRDAEIENLLKQYTRPIFQAAGIKPGAVHIYIVREDNINAFVAEGQNVFVNTGLLTRAKNPNQLIGVLAHETGHMAGGHLARARRELQNASIQSIIGMMAGVATTVGGAVLGSDAAAQAGTGIMLGSQGTAQRRFLSYQRDMEASADQAALKYLAQTHQSPRGMLDLFQRLANESLASTANSDPYLYSHPMPLTRIRTLELEAKKSPYFDAVDSPAAMLRFNLMQAKLYGFLYSPQQVYNRYPTKDTSLPARYARAISAFRTGNTQNALEMIDGLIHDVPADPYFYELKGQALLDGGQAQAALAPLQKASQMLPDSGLLHILYAQALVATNNKANGDQALKILIAAKRNEPMSVEIYTYLSMIYGARGDYPRASLASAEVALLTGDEDTASKRANGALRQFKVGTPEWLRAQDIINYVARKKS